MRIRISDLGPIGQEVKQIFKFVLPIIELDPSIHVKRFLGKLPHLRTPLYSDASGNEHLSTNPTPNTLG